MSLSKIEENYLKEIYNLIRKNEKPIKTNDISKKLNVKASSVTSMIKKLANKQLIDYIKYKGVFLTPKGEEFAMQIIRKHRLWEVFLVRHLKFKWNEIHEIAEQLEHIKSTKLTDKLDDFLNNPEYDPHGDPIPNKDGCFLKREIRLLSSLKLNEESEIVGIKDNSDDFLKYLDDYQIKPGIIVKILYKEKFDNSMKILIKEETVFISEKTAKKLYVK